MKQSKIMKRLEETIETPLHEIMDILHKNWDSIPIEERQLVLTWICVGVIDTTTPHENIPKRLRLMAEMVERKNEEGRKKGTFSFHI